MKNDVAGLDMEIPIVAAPMSGGPTTPALVVAAARAGSFGFLAGGYKTAEAVQEQIREVRTSVSNFGVNLFAPNPLPVDPAEFRTYADAISAEGERFGLEISAPAPKEDDDQWREKIDVLIAEPVPAVSFTFGIPDRSVIASLRNAGCLVVQTVTSPAEARIAADRDAEILVVQGPEAGGHYGTITPRRPLEGLPALSDLLREVKSAVDLPLLAAGGIAEPAHLRQVLDAGAQAAMVGTVLLRTHESGASPTYKDRLGYSGESETIVTRAFSGRPARGLPNYFTRRYGPIAPFGYPAIHHLTSPMRRAAAEAGDSERINLWAGTGYRLAREESVADTLLRLAADS